MTITDTTIAPLSADWKSHSPSSGNTATAHLGSTAIDGHTVEVFLDFDPERFAAGRAKGRSESTLSSPDLTIGHGRTALFFPVETLDIDPLRYLTAAPFHVLTFRPQWAPVPAWKVRTLACGLRVHEATLATITMPSMGARPVVVRYDRKLAGLIDDYAIATTSKKFMVAVKTTDVTPYEALARLAQVPALN
ncbi:hypothetical protein ABZY32_16520 [Nocardiopsis alba]|uniref:hypothetical protein n=1 Tax=Nocardiopsis alba TaxID=53437 RepID=UPI0033B7C567